MRTGTVGVFLLLAAGTARGESRLEQARIAAKALEFNRAAAALNRVAASSGLSQAEVLEFYELSGVVAALKGDAKRARRAFTVLLVLSPSFKLRGRHPPKVTTPFAEAKASARDLGAVTASVAIEATEGAFVTSLKLTVGSANGLVERLQVEVVEDGARRTAIVGAESTRFATHAREVSVRVKALGARDWALTESEPQLFSGPPEPQPVSVDAPTTVPARPAEAPEVAHQPAALGGGPPTALALAEPPRLRPLAVGLVASGVACAAAGILMGLRSRNARAALDHTTVENGVVVSLTRTQALALDQQVVSGAIVADALFLGAGALVLAGATTWLLGSSSPRALALAPLRGGFSVGFSGVW